jgi:hypothetical protein
MKCRVRDVRMGPAVSIDAAQPVSVRFAQHRYAPWGEQDFHCVVSDQHPGWMCLREAAEENQARLPSLFLREHLLDLLRCVFVPGRRIGPNLRVLISDLGVPDAAPIRELCEVSPVLRRWRRVDDGGQLLGSFSGLDGGCPKGEKRSKQYRLLMRRARPNSPGCREVSKRSVLHPRGRVTFDHIVIMRECTRVPRGQLS